MKRTSPLLPALFLIILLALYVLPAGVVADGRAENQYATVEWQTEVSTERMEKGEQFFATLDLLSTIKAIPSEYSLLIKEANRSGGDVIVSYKLIAQNHQSGEQIVMRTDSITRPLPKLLPGATLEFADERIPLASDEYLSFPQAAELGSYALFVRLVRAEITDVPFFGSVDVTEYVLDFLPPMAFGAGIELADVGLFGKALGVTINPAGSGSVSYSPSWSAWGYDAGADVSLAAVANADYVFDHWSGDVSGTGVAAMVTMDSDKTITAHFVYEPPEEEQTGGTTGGTAEEPTEEPSLPSSVAVMIEEVIREIEGGFTASVSAGQDFTAEDVTLGQVEAKVDIELNAVPEGASVEVATSLEPSAEASSAFQLVAAGGGLAIVDVAYVINVVKTGMENSTDVSRVTITMKVGADWVSSHGGTDAIKILRFDPDTGEQQILETRFLGQDAEGRAIFEGISPDGLSIFGLVALAETSPPAVVSTSPIDGSIDVAIGASITAEFSANMNPESINNTTFTVAAGAAAIAGNVSYHPTKKVAVFDPAENLSYGTTYTATVTTGAKDQAGKGLAGDYSWSFTVAPMPTPEYGLMAGVDPAGGGIVNFDPPRSANRYDAGMVVTLKATASSGYEFDHWSGDAGGTSAITTVTMDSDRNIAAHFVSSGLPTDVVVGDRLEKAARKYKFSAGVDPAGAGTIRFDPLQPADGYDAGTEVTLTATANQGYTFDHWSGDASGSDATYTITMNSDKGVIAHLVPGEAIDSVVERQRFENEYALVEWDTKISKQELGRGEDFYATLNLVSTVKKIPERVNSIIVGIVNMLSPRAFVQYAVVGRNTATGEKTILGYDTITKPFPELKEGAALAFTDERVPSSGYLSFPPEAEYGHYTLSIRLMKVGAKIAFFTQDVTGMIKGYVPPQVFDSGIKVAEIELTDVPSPSATASAVVSTLPEDGATDVPVGGSFSVSFSREMDPATINASTFVLPVAANVIYDAATKMATISPTGDLAYNTSYEVIVTTRARDSAGNALGEPYRWTFITEAKPSSLGLLGGIIGGAVVLVGLLAYLLVKRRGQKV